jgi:hypothetical protein
MRARGYLAAFPTLLKEHVKKEIYQNYTAETERMMLENMAKLCGGSYIEQKYADLVNFKPQETRTEEEIIARVKRALGGGQAEPV